MKKAEHFSAVSFKKMCMFCQEGTKGQSFAVDKRLFAIPIQILQEKPYSSPWLPSWTTLKQAEKTLDLHLCSTVGILRLLKLDKKVMFNQVIQEMENLF